MTSQTAPAIALQGLVKSFRGPDGRHRLDLRRRPSRGDRRRRGWRDAADGGPGHLLSSDSIGPAVGGLVGVLALLGGSWFPISGHGFLHYLAQALPSYWLVQASHVGLGDGGWGIHGWLVMAAWSAALVAVAIGAYPRDTARAG
jgi:hypothetical protein